MRRTLSRLAPLVLLATACAEGKDPPPPANRVLIQGGSFTMGSEDRDPCGLNDAERLGCGALEQSESIAHEVNVTSFCLDRTEVTVEQYRHCVARDECSKPLITNTGQIQTPSYIRRYYNEPDTYKDHPVVGVTHAQAQAFCESKGGRLPSEAEWEFAATSGGVRKTTVWSEDDNEGLGRLIEGACPEARGQIALGECSDTVRPVGSSARDVTAQGILDMAGNVSEWVADEFDFTAYCESSEGIGVERVPGQQNYAFFQGGTLPAGLVSDFDAVTHCRQEIPCPAPGCSAPDICIQGRCQARPTEPQQTPFSVCRSLCTAYPLTTDAGGSPRELVTDGNRRDWLRRSCFERYQVPMPGLSDRRGLAADSDRNCDPNDPEWCGPDVPPELCAGYCSCLNTDLSEVPRDGTDCVDRCIEDFDACAAPFVAPGTVSICVPGRSSLPSPWGSGITPWCVPAQGRTSRDVRRSVPPRLSFYDGDLAHVVRGGEVGTARVCEARPTRRQARNGAVSIVGFRCAYDLVGGACPTLE